MDARPSIVLVVIDALRADCTPGAEPSPHLRTLGLQPPALPNLSRLVEGASCFTQAYACSSYTPVCFASLFTGLLPPEHGVRTFHSHALNGDVRTLAEILAQAGYATCGMSDVPWLLQRCGLWRGFQTVVNTEEEALAWWDAYGGAPRLLLLHFFDVHEPYGVSLAPAARAGHAQIVQQWQERLTAHGIALPRGHDAVGDDTDIRSVLHMQMAWTAARGFKAGLEEYIAGLRHIDQTRLALLKDEFTARRILDECIFVVTADHGEGRGAIPAARRLTHGSTVADDQLHVPLYIRVPGSRRRIISAQASQVDIAPTILDVVGLLSERTPPRAPLSGRSLAPALRGRWQWPRPIYAELHQMFSEERPEELEKNRAPAVLRYRCLRYPRRKYRLAGRLVEADGALLTCTPEEFFMRLYRDLLARAESPKELAAAVASLVEKHGPNATRRRAIVEKWQQGQEYQRLVKHAVYDLRRDPLEEHPSDPRRGLLSRMQYRRRLETMDAIERYARLPAPLLEEPSDQAVVQQRLAALGYVE